MFYIQKYVTPKQAKYGFENILVYTNHIKVFVNF